MNGKSVLFSLLLIFEVLICFPLSGNAESAFKSIAVDDTITPENTIILATEMDLRFSQDFSPLLKHLRLDWMVLGSTKLPDALHDKNIILLGHPD